MWRFKGFAAVCGYDVNDFDMALSRRPGSIEAWEHCEREHCCDCSEVQRVAAEQDHGGAPARMGRDVQQRMCQPTRLNNFKAFSHSSAIDL